MQMFSANFHTTVQKPSFFLGVWERAASEPGDMTPVMG